MAKKETKDSAQPSGAPYPADWKVDEQQRPATLIESKRRNAASPAAFERYKASVTEKAEKFGIIHVDPATGYRARFHAADEAA